MTTGTVTFRVYMEGWGRTHWGNGESLVGAIGTLISQVRTTGTDQDRADLSAELVKLSEASELARYLLHGPS